jgi:acetyl-CoA acetyltransferase family protein
MTDAFIIDAVRTPRSRRKGKFSSVHPADLLTFPLNALKTRHNLPVEEVEDVVMGCVTQTGEQGWCIARSGVLAAGWPHTVPATTVNRLCGSGQQATNFVAAGIKGGAYGLAISGGLEHMTRCPMFSDIGGEESIFLKRHHPDLVQQGPAAEILAKEFKISRSQADEYAYTSQLRAKVAASEGRFTSIIPVQYTDENGQTQTISADDTIRGDTTVQGLGALKTVFDPNGIITAGNASAIVDGAAAILLASEQKAKALNLTPRARVVAMKSIGSPPRIMLTGPIEASRLCLKEAGLTGNDIDLWEINEAFAPVPLVTMQELNLDPAKVNVNGGGISLGHPLGATGAMLIGTALDELERTGKKRALITMCIGLGMGIATIIERV